MRTSPPVGCSRPAMSRSKVVLPQPDGPSRTRYSPSSVTRSMPSTAVVCPNSLRSDLVSTTAIAVTSCPGGVGSRVPLHQALGPPLGVDGLALLGGGRDGLLRRRLSLRRAGHHGRENVGVEDLPFCCVRRARVPDVRRPLRGVGQQRELVRRVRLEGIGG